MTLPSFVLAYHGCDRAVGERILAGADHVRVSTNDYDWLGEGAYFWENSPARALEWASFSPAISEPFAVGAIIDPGLCLDLTEARGLSTFKEAYGFLVESFTDLGVPLPANESGFVGDEDLVKRHLDCAVATALHEVRAEQGKLPFNTLRAAFFEGGALYPGTRIAAKTHVQWCVRDPQRSVRGYFRPLPGSED